jgi:uncharacterized membrane protein YiaA
VSDPGNNSPTPLSTIIALALLMAAVAVYYVAVVILSGYNEGGTLILGLMVGAFALTLTWKTRAQKLKTAVSTILILAICISGVLFIRIGQYQSRVSRVIAQHMVQSVGQSLLQMQELTGSMPDCKWKCMKKELMMREYWTGLEIPYAQTTRTLPIQEIPHLDGWGCRYSYEKSANGAFVLKSSGPDRRFFTKDDIIYESGAKSPLALPELPVFGKSSKAD